MKPNDALSLPVLLLLSTAVTADDVTCDVVDDDDVEERAQMTSFVADNTTHTHTHTRTQTHTDDNYNKSRHLNVADYYGRPM